MSLIAQNLIQSILSRRDPVSDPLVVNVYQM